MVSRATVIRVQLISKPGSRATGIGRYGWEIERGLRQYGVDVVSAPLKNPIPGAVSGLARRAGYDLDAFAHSYPVRADVQPGRAVHPGALIVGHVERGEHGGTADPAGDQPDVGDAQLQRGGQRRLLAAAARDVGILETRKCLFRGALNWLLLQELGNELVARKDPKTAVRALTLARANCDADICRPGIDKDLAAAKAAATKK